MGGLQSFELIVKEMIADARIRFSVKGRMATLDKRCGLQCERASERRSVIAAQKKVHSLQCIE